MANFLIGYDNQADSINNFSGSGAMQANFPIQNLADYRLGKKARSTDATAANTKFGFVLPATVYTQVVGLAGTNASTAAQYRLRLYSDAALTVQVYDSTTLALFPAGSMPNSQIPAGSSNSGTGKPTDAQFKLFQRNVIHVLAAGLQVRSGLLEIIDTANPDGYVEAGRLFVGRAFQPTYNPPYGAVSRRLTSRTDVSRARDGTPYFTRRRPLFSIPFALQDLTQDEAAKALELQAIVDLVGDVIVIEDPADSTYWWMRQIFGQLKTLDPIEFPKFANFKTAFQVEGTL